MLPNHSSIGGGRGGLCFFAFAPYQCQAIWTSWELCWNIVCQRSRNSELMYYSGLYSMIMPVGSLVKMFKIVHI